VNLFPVVGGSYVLNGLAAVIVEARGGPTRKGVYNVGLTVAPVTDPFNFVYAGSNNIVFDSILSGTTLASQAAGVTQGVKSIYFQTRDTNSDTYIATNVKENFSPIQVSNNPVVNDLNPANFSPGQYEVCANLESIPSAPFIDTAEQCANFTREGPSFLVGAQLRAVREGESFGGLKFRKERRAYRQAGRQVRCADGLTVRGGGPVDRFVSYSGGSERAERSACGSSGASAAVGCGGPICTSENPGPATYIREARALLARSSLARAVVQYTRRGAACDGTRFFRTERRFYRSAAGAVRRFAKPSVSLGERALASPRRIRTYRLAVYIECPSRIQTWESVWIAAPCAGCSARWTKGVPEGTDRVTAAVRRLKKVPAVGELRLAVRRGFLPRCSEDFLCRICAAPEGSRLVATAGKAGKKDRGGCNG
jgi:hypothetical protein